jgi:hypothetical protein
MMFIANVMKISQLVQKLFVRGHSYVNKVSQPDWCVVLRVVSICELESFIRECPGAHGTPRSTAYGSVLK